MPRNRDQQQHAELQENIKATARRHMATDGTAALSLRAIARDLDVTAPALYRYFASRDDLITALILDAYNAQADALQAEDALHHDADPATRLYAVLLRYRTWALEHPIDFQLIYGNPIPGYVAPEEATIAAARRNFEVVVAILQAAHETGQLHPPAAYTNLPPSIGSYLAHLAQRDGYPVAPHLLYIATAGWARIHGIIMLELFTHIQPVIGDTAAFYRAEVRQLMHSMGLAPPSAAE